MGGQLMEAVSFAPGTSATLWGTQGWTLPHGCVKIHGSSLEREIRIWRNDRVSQLVRAKITALGAYVPPRLLTNDDLEKLVETSNEGIVERTGIRERHIVDQGVATSDLATEAAHRALAQRGLEPSDLDAILVATVTPDMFFPSTACLVEHKLGAKGVWGFDLSAACSAFVYALQVGTQFVATGTHKRVMVIGSDVMSPIIDYSAPPPCIIFGDGAGAVILEPADTD